jgi:hypothetical protein
MTKTFRLVRALLVAVVVAVLGLILAAPAQAAPPAKSIVPFMNCYWDNGNGTYTVSIGYNNKNNSVQTVPIGTNNRFVPGNQNRGQPTTFKVGTQNNAFIVTASAADVANDVNWFLTGNSVSIQTPVRCTTKPVSQVGSMRALGLALVLLVSIGLTVLYARTRHAADSHREVTS